jgi:hypothetical protein
MDSLRGSLSDACTYFNCGCQILNVSEAKLNVLNSTEDC